MTEPTSAHEEPAKDHSTKKLIAVLTVVMLLALGGTIFYTWHRNHVANEVPDKGPEYHTSADDMVLPRKMYQDKMSDVKALDGKRIWVWAGDQMNYFPATPTHLDYQHPAGLLLGAEPLDVVNFIEQKAPEGVFLRIPRGDKQVVMLFHRPEEPGKLFGTPVGYEEGGSFTFYLDEAYFYDDPHTLWHWPAATWDAIDHHKAILGMSERQAQLALGQVSKPGEGTSGNRTVTYDNNGHPVTVTFHNDKATSIS